MKDIAILELGEEAVRLAEELLRGVPLPAKAGADALHIAICAVSGMDYLLTWNCAHIANAVLRGEIESVCRNFGCTPPRICTPEGLMGDEYDVDR